MNFYFQHLMCRGNLCSYCKCKCNEKYFCKLREGIWYSEADCINAYPNGCPTADQIITGCD